jgi:hypothetical protein
MTDMTAAPPGAEPQAQAEAAPSPEAAAAREQINSLRTDKAFLSKFAAGDAQARQQMHDLHVRAWPVRNQATPGPGAGPAADISDKAGAGYPGAESEPLDISLPLAFDENTPLADMKQLHALGQEVVKNLAIEPESANGAVKMIETALAARPKDADGAPMAMGATELSKMEFILHERWGTEYEANTQAFHTALKKAGGKGGEWIRRALLAAGPTVAAGMMDNLARRMRAANARKD